MLSSPFSSFRGCLPWPWRWGLPVCTSLAGSPGHPSSPVPGGRVPRLARSDWAVFLGCGRTPPPATSCRSGFKSEILFFT